MQIKALMHLHRDALQCAAEEEPLANICSAICMSHSPFIYSQPEEWEHARVARAARGAIAAHVPIDTPAQNCAKHSRCADALRVLSSLISAANADVIVIFGDDQSEQFDFSNYPAISIFAGKQLAGFKISDKFGLPVPGAAREPRPKTDEHWTEVPGHPTFARNLIVRLMSKGFDVGFSLQLPKPELGLGHAFMRPLNHLTSATIPVVPISINCYFGPQPTGNRCVQFGRAVREAITEMKEETRVALVGSGGLWHMPMFPNATLDEEFDRAMLSLLAKGQAEEMGAYFDRHSPPVDLTDPKSVKLFSGGSGMVLGYGGGTGETRNWIVTAAVMDGKPATVVDYIPVYASPVGLGFAYWSGSESV